MEYQTLLFEIKDGIALITINRPDKLNALNDQVMAELADVAQRLATDDVIRGAILTGAGPKAFVAGADIGDLAKQGPFDGKARALRGQAVLRRLETCGKPVIAAVNGFALGGGCELAMACRLRIASEHAKFGQPEVKLGIAPGYGGTQRLPRLVGKGVALQLILTGETIDAREAHRIGLVNKVVPLIHGFQREPDRERAHGEDAAQQLLRFGEELGRGNHLVDEPDAVRFPGVDCLAREDQLQRDALTDEARQTLGPAVAGCNAELQLGLAELGVLTRDAQVAGHRELAPAAQREAVHRRDHRLPARLESPQHGLAAQRAGLTVERALLGEVSDVGPRHEGLGAGPGEDRSADIVVRGQALGHVGELRHHLVVQRVELVGTVDGDQRHSVPNLEQQGLVGHGPESYTKAWGVGSGSIRRAPGSRSAPSRTTPHSPLPT